jgi:hypothetical protein
MCQVFCVFRTLPRGTKPQPQSNVLKEKRLHRSNYLLFKGEDIHTMMHMVAEFLDNLDSAGFSEQCQTQQARFPDAYIVLFVCLVSCLLDLLFFLVQRFFTLL